MFLLVKSMPSLEIYPAVAHGRSFAGMRDGFTARRCERRNL